MYFFHIHINAIKWYKGNQGNDKHRIQDAFFFRVVIFIFINFFFLHSTFKFLNFILFIYLFRLHQLLVVACGIQFPNQGSNLGPLYWEWRVLPTGLPGKPLNDFFNWSIVDLYLRCTAKWFSYKYIINV